MKLNNANRHVSYKYPYTGKEVILVINNALYHVQQNIYNLLTPFLVREVGHYTSETLKMHQKYPIIDDHVTYLEEVKMRIHLNLHSIVSYFTTQKPTASEIESLPHIYLTPDVVE